MSEIRVLSSNEIPSFIDIVSKAYPVFDIHTDEDVQMLIKRLERGQEEGFSADCYGLFRDDCLLGGMRFLDFEMNFRGQPMSMGGVGLVAVDMLHKKEAVCKEMIHYFLHQYRNRRVPLVGLYAFRLDFYHQMGLGFGAPTRQYKLKPARLPQETQRHHLRFLTEADKPAIHSCYHKYFNSHHGMIRRSDFEINELFNNPKLHLVGFFENETLDGYIAYAAKPHDGFACNIRIAELISNIPDAWQEIWAFLYTQYDQAPYVIFDSQEDDFYHMLSNPSNDKESVVPLHHQSAQEEIGLMYRIVNFDAFIDGIAPVRFFTEDLVLGIDIEDDFLPENSGVSKIQFIDGKAHKSSNATADITIRMNVRYLSSLIMGSVRFRSLIQYGLADITDKSAVSAIDTLFRCERPMCITRF